MSNKIFIFFVVVLTILIIISSILLFMSIAKYQTTTDLKDSKPSVLVDKPVPKTQEDTPKKEETKTENTSSTTSKDKDYILPTDSREILKTEIENMDKETLNRAYNEIFARHGHDFKTASLKEYFNSKSWYKPISGKTVDVSELTDVEAKNLSLIKARIDEISN